MTVSRQQLELDKLIKGLQASPLKFWTDRNTCLSKLESLGREAEPALGEALKYLCKKSFLVNAARVFRSVGPPARQWIPTLIQEFNAKTRTGEAQVAVGIVYAMALLPQVKDRYNDDLKEFFDKIIANPQLNSGVRFCAALGARSHGYLDVADSDHVMYEHIEALVIKNSGRSLFPSLDIAEPLLSGPLPSAFLKHYEKSQWGITLHLPRWVEVYDGDNPGPMRPRISSETPLWLVNSGIPGERCNVKMDQNLTDSDMAQAKEELESNPPPLRQYRRISMKWITLGKEKNKRAFEHIHALEQSVPKKLRQIGFSHRNRGYVFTFSTSPERYEMANKWFFDVVISAIEFH